MKRFFTAMIAMLAIAISAKAMSYSQARNEALFLTDKMAYELNLNDEQYEAAYEINLDYLMSVSTSDEILGTYWTRRNLDISYILLDWQWEAFRAATYFYRPLYWSAGSWHFHIYSRYTHRDYFYFGRPTFYATYRGGHSWRSNGNRSYYFSRRDTYHGINNNHHGMRDRWDSGSYRNGHFSSTRNSSTRSTVNRDGHFGNRSTDSKSHFGSSERSARQSTGTSYRNSTNGSSHSSHNYSGGTFRSSGSSSSSFGRSSHNSGSSSFRSNSSSGTRSSGSSSSSSGGHFGGRR